MRPKILSYEKRLYTFSCAASTGKVFTLAEFELDKDNNVFDVNFEVCAIPVAAFLLRHEKEWNGRPISEVDKWFRTIALLEGWTELGND